MEALIGFAGGGVAAGAAAVGPLVRQAAPLLRQAAVMGDVVRPETKECAHA